MLLSDIGLPGDDGYALIRAVRRMPGGTPRELPAAAVTGQSRPEDRERTLREGYQVHLAKPVDPDRVIEVVADLARPS